VNFKLPVGYETAGRVAVISLLPSDALASDDLYWLALDAPAAPRILILEEAGKGPESLAPAWHLKTALSVLAKDRSGWQALTVRTPGRVTREEIDRAEVILLADLPDWSGDLGARIAARVRQGAGLVVFLGPASKPAFYNDFFAQTGLSVPPLVPVRLAAKRPVPSGTGLAASPVGAVAGRHLRRFIAGEGFGLACPGNRSCGGTLPGPGPSQRRKAVFDGVRIGSGPGGAVEYLG
jgi:hypothetical protein